MRNSTRYIESYGTALPIAVVCCGVVLNAIYLLVVGTMLSQRKDLTASVETQLPSIAPGHVSGGVDPERRTLAGGN